MIPLIQQSLIKRCEVCKQGFEIRPESVFIDISAGHCLFIDECVQNLSNLKSSVLNIPFHNDLYSLMSC